MFRPLAGTRQLFANRHDEGECGVDFLWRVTFGAQSLFDFRERQLADPQLASIPVLCMSAVYQPEDVMTALRVNCLAKPLDFGRLIDEIATTCGRP